MIIVAAWVVFGVVVVVAVYKFVQHLQDYNERQNEFLLS